MRRSGNDAPAIEVRQLTKTYHSGAEAVKGIDFVVRRGEVFGLLGPNGAGKSTTIGMLTTTVRPTGGSVRVLGHDVARDPIAARGASAVVFQEPVVDRLLSGRANLAVHARLWGIPPARARRRIAEVAATFGLADLLDRTVASYSGGERRRLEIARALLSEPAVLFLDEPTVGLDTRIRYELLDVIGRLRDAVDLSILLTTHYLDEAEHLCDRVGIMHAGRIVALDAPAALLAELGSELIDLHVTDDPIRALSALRSFGVAGADAYVVGSTLTIPLRDRTARESMAAIERTDVTYGSITARPPTLDDVYLRYTGESLAA